MRPRGTWGEVRAALLASARQLAPPVPADPAARAGLHGPTWRELAAHSAVGFAKAKQTVRDMVRAGDLHPIGTRRAPHSCRPMVMLAPGSDAARAAPVPASGADLEQCLRGWHIR